MQMRKTDAPAHAVAGIKYSIRSSQQGASLVIGLIMLLLLTIIGVTSIRTTVIQEKMAGNLKDYNAAFQAAEAGLRDGEQLLATGVLPTFDNSSGYYQPLDWGDLFYWDKTDDLIDWDDNDSIKFDESIVGVSNPPRHVIEELPFIPASGGSKKFGPITGTGVFRVTALGVGGANTTRVILQSTYRR